MDKGLQKKLDALVDQYSYNAVIAALIELCYRRAYHRDAFALRSMMRDGAKTKDDAAKDVADICRDFGIR